MQKIENSTNEKLFMTEFTYQNYWLRVFMLLPVIILLPYVEQKIFPEIDIRLFYLVATIITIVTVDYSVGNCVLCI